MDYLTFGSHHATAVTFNNFGILILGQSGAGKSHLAMQLIGRNAQLISDDVVTINENLDLSKPDGGPALIEIRNIGLFNAPTQQRATLKLIVHLDIEESNRLPIKRTTRIGEHHVVLIAGKGIPNLDIAVAHFAKYGRAEP